MTIPWRWRAFPVLSTVFPRFPRFGTFAIQAALRPHWSSSATQCNTSAMRCGRGLRELCIIFPPLVGESKAGVDSSSRTPKRRTLEADSEDWPSTHARVLVDSRSTGNYIDSRECIARRIKIEAEDQSEEIKMADGTVVKTEGRVQFVLKCGGYRRQISTRVFPNMYKPMILGIPQPFKGKPPHRLDSGYSGSE